MSPSHLFMNVFTRNFPALLQNLEGLPSFFHIQNLVLRSQRSVIFPSHACGINVCFFHYSFAVIFHPDPIVKRQKCLTMLSIKSRGHTRLQEQP